MSLVIPPGISRRQLLQLLGYSGAAASLGASPAFASPAGKDGIVTRAAATAPAGSDLGAVEHVVFLMMENRSYDHFFGAYPKGRGFDDHPDKSLGAFAQAYPGAGTLTPPNVLLPFRMTKALDEDCTDDLTHDWGPQHLSWNNGAMDSFVKTHTSSAYEGARGAVTMGYYTRDELPFYWALADNFTLMDGYHASLLGPTYPNRLMQISGTIDPGGKAGGPITDTDAGPAKYGTCTWPTAMEVLEDANVSWKYYSPTNANLSTKYADLAAFPTWANALYNPDTNPALFPLGDTVLPYFKSFQSPTSTLYQKGFLPTFPNDFVSDIANKTLPSVSWVMPPSGFDDHPSASPDHGQYFVSLVLDALMSDADTWSKTVLFLMYDENDGFFDHVPPPMPPAGTPGEFVTTPASTLSADTNGFTNLGLGVRVPALMLSPFSRGGHIVSEVSDHTSQLKFLEARFGIQMPNISAWRRQTVGDLTSTLFQGAADMSMPALPATAVGSAVGSGNCAESNQALESGGSDGILPTGEQLMPTQTGLLIPASYFTGSIAAATAAPAATVAEVKAKKMAAKVATKHEKRKSTATAKSTFNRLAQPKGTLAYTGLDPALAAAGALMVAAGLAAVRVNTRHEPEAVEPSDQTS